MIVFLANDGREVGSTARGRGWECFFFPSWSRLPRAFRCVAAHTGFRRIRLFDLTCLQRQQIANKIMVAPIQTAGITKKIMTATWLESPSVSLALVVAIVVLDERVEVIRCT